MCLTHPTDYTNILEDLFERTISNLKAREAKILSICIEENSPHPEDHEHKIHHKNQVHHKPEIQNFLEEELKIDQNLKKNSLEILNESHKDGSVDQSISEDSHDESKSVNNL